MSRHGILTAIFLALLPIGLAHGDIHWINAADEANSYVFSVTKNYGMFYYSPTGAVTLNEAIDYKAYREDEGETDPYDSVAEGAFTEFGDMLRMHAGAWGPRNDANNSVNPTNGLEVHAFAQVVTNSLNELYGIDTEQIISSWSTRWFTLDQTAEYELKADLAGDLLFDGFGSSTENEYFATGDITAEMTLSGQVETETGDLDTTEIFTSTITLETPISETLTLHTTDDEGRPITYELFISINLSSKIKNTHWENQLTTILGPIDGTFNLGTPEAPMALKATLTKSSDSGEGSHESTTDPTTDNPTTPKSDDGGGSGGGCFITTVPPHKK